MGLRNPFRVHFLLGGGLTQGFRSCLTRPWAEILDPVGVFFSMGCDLEFAWVAVRFFW